jgi:hypothetical protein
MKLKNPSTIPFPWRGSGNELSSWCAGCTVNYLRGRVIPEYLLSILKIENPNPEGASMVFLLLRQSAGVMEHRKTSNSKHQIPGFQVSGVRCQ